jgi:NADH:ubiquinone oxidoreductase subunit 3 (subunit A)
MNEIGWVFLAYVLLFIVINLVGMLYLHKCVAPTQKSIDRKIKRNARR